MTKQLLWLGAALALAFTVLLSPWRTTPTAAQMGPGQGQGGGHGPMMGPPLEQLSGDAFDRMFMIQMVMHHSMAVMMAKPAAANAQHQELKDQANQIISDQTREIGQMRGWLQAWYGVNMPDMVGMMEGMSSGQMPMMPGMPGMDQMPMGGMHDMSMMSSFWQLPSNRLEAVFMSQMIPHHQGAIDMAGLVPSRAAHQELKDLAQGIVSSQSAEIQTLNTWLAAWYSL